MNGFEEFDEFEEFENFGNENRWAVRAPKRYVRDFQNPLEWYDESNFKRRFRFSKHAVLHGLLPKVEEGLRKPNRRGMPVKPVLQLLVALRFYATASFQMVCGDLEYVSQSTVSKIILRVSLHLASHLRDVVKFPTTVQSATENRRLFRDMGQHRNTPGLPGIDGALDCTHVRLAATKFGGFPEHFRNRKGYFSLNVQAVVGPRGEFLDLVPEWPGSEHDSRIFQNSRLFITYRDGEQSGRLVADSAYPCLPFVLTPIRQPQGEAEGRYNFVQRRTRNIIERVFGMSKRRCPCLSRGLTTKLFCSTTIVAACAVLWNLSLMYDHVMPEDEQPFENEVEIPVQPADMQPLAGVAVRRALIQQLYDY